MIEKKQDKSIIFHVGEILQHMKNSKKLFMTFMVLSVLQNIGSNLAHPVTPSLIVSLNLGSSIFGIAFACMSFSNFLTSPFWGKMTSVIGERKLMASGSFLYAAAQFFFMISKTSAGIAGARLLAGVGVGAIYVGASTYVLRISDEKDRGSHLTLLVTSQTVAGTIGYFIGGMIGDINIYYSFIVQIITLVIVGILYLIFVDDSAPHTAMNTKAIAKEANPFRSLMNGKEIMTPLLALIFIAAFVASMGSTAFDQSFNYYIKDVFDFKPSYNGMIKAATGILALVVNMTVCIQLQKRGHLAKYLTYIFLGCGILLFALTQAPSIAVLIGLDLAYFAVNSLYLPLMQNLAAQYADKKTNGLVMGFLNSIKSFGQIIGALMEGLLYSLKPAFPFFFACFSFLLSTFVIVFYRGKAKQSA